MLRNNTNKIHLSKLVELQTVILGTAHVSRNVLTIK